MSRKTVLLFVAAIAMLTACGPENADKPPRKMLIPEDKLVAILTDSYLTSGMLDVPGIRETWGQRDSILNYIDVIESYGYTYEQFQATMRYYFADKPKNLAGIYDRVTGNLLELEAKVQNESKIADSIPGKNLWTGKKAYKYPEDIDRDPIWFDIPVETPGEYIFRADILVFKDDGSLDPRVTVYFSTVDSLGVDVRDDWEEVRLEKNGRVKTIELRKVLNAAGNTHIKGWLMNHTNQAGDWHKHALITNISLTFKKPEVSLQQ
jgi:hypothetical protein